MLRFVSLSLLIACGSSGSPDVDGGADAAADSRPADSGGADSDSGGGACACGAGEGCLRGVITRIPSDTQLPWKVWPMEADGAGTLIAAATATTLVRKTIPSADLKPASPAYKVDFGCVS